MIRTALAHLRAQWMGALALQSCDVRTNTLTGSDILEESLGTVPGADPGVRVHGVPSERW